MTARRPLVLVSGIQSELPTGDTIDAALYQGQQIVAGSGLVGGGLFSTDPRLDLALASNPSGLYFSGDDKLGFDGQSSSIQFVASASGVSSRTVETKLQDVISVKDFGAVGDGSTDDGAAFLAASDAISSGQTLFIPAGHYILNTDNNSSEFIANNYSYLAFSSSSNISIVGESVESTIIELTGTDYPCPIYFRNCDNILVRDLTIIGNNQAPNSTSQAGNALWAYYGTPSSNPGNVRFENLYLKEFKGSNWLSVYNGSSSDIYDVLIDKVVCEGGSDRDPTNIGASADQITVYTNSTGWIYDVLISNCICHADDVKKGIAFKDNVAKAVINSCQVYNAGANNPNLNTGRYGIMSYNNGKDIVISNCIVDGGEDTNLYLLDVDHYVVSNCILSNHKNGVASNLEKGALASVSSQGVVTGCVFRDNTINVTLAPAQKGYTVSVDNCSFEGGNNQINNPLSTAQSPSSVDAYGGGFYNCKFFNSSILFKGVGSPDRFYYGFTIRNNQFYAGSSITGSAPSILFGGSDNGKQFRNVVFDGNYVEHTGGASPSRCISGQGGRSFDDGLQITNNTFKGTFSGYVIALYEAYDITLTNNTFLDSQPTISGTEGYIFYLVQSRGHVKDNIFNNCNDNRSYLPGGSEILGRSLPTWTGEPGFFVQNIDNSSVYTGLDGFNWNENLQIWSYFYAPSRGIDLTSSNTVEVNLSPIQQGSYLVSISFYLGNYSRNYLATLMISENYAGSVVNNQITLTELDKTAATDTFFGTLTVDFDYYASTTAAYTGSYYTSTTVDFSTEGRPTKLKFRLNGRLGGPSFSRKQVTLTNLAFS